MSNNIINFSLHNPIDKEPHEMEDAIEIKFDNGIKSIAISDGAGGVGIYCKEWANYLVNHSPNFLFSEEKINEWFMEISQNFFHHQINNINIDNSVKDKFITTGSFATSLYLWIDYNKKTLYYTGVGDSTVFILRKSIDDYETILIYPIDKNEFLDQNPLLLNWRIKNKIDKINSIQIQNGDIVIAATDAISRWILLNLRMLNPIIIEKLCPNLKIDENTLINFKLDNYTFNNLDDLLNYLKNTEFQKLDNLKNMIISGVLEADDYTLYIETI